MRRFFRIFTAIGILASACAAPDRSQAAERPWLKASTPHFELYTTASEGQAKRTLLLYEKLRGFFLQALGLQTQRSEKIAIIGFRNLKEFEPFKPNEFASAYYLGGYERDYIVIGDLGPDIQRTAIHEYVHLLVRNTSLKPPVWLNEGLAEFYSTLEPLAGKVLVGKLPGGRVRTLQRKKWVDLDTLLNVDHGSPLYNERARAGVFYAQSWALTHMLLRSAEYRERFPLLLPLLGSGMEPAEAVRQVYSLSLEELQKSLRSYIAQDRFSGAVFDVKVEKAALNPEFAPASDLEAGLVLGRLLDRSRDRQEDAQVHYAALAERYPDSPEVAEALGLLARRGERFDEAEVYFRRASELGSTNPELYRRLAYLLKSKGQIKDRITALRASLRLDPSHDPTRRFLGFELLRDEQWIQALAQLQLVKSVDETSDAFALYNARAYAWMKIDRDENARKDIATAKRFIESPAQTDRIAQLEKHLDYKQGLAQRAAKREAAGDAGQEPTIAAPGPASRPFLERSEDLPRRQSQPLPPPPPSFEGRLTHFDCSSSTALLTLESDEQSQQLAIVDPTAVVIVSKQGGELEFTCGPQGGRLLRVEYREDASLPGGVGEVTLIEAY